MDGEEAIAQKIRHLLVKIHQISRRRDVVGGRGDEDNDWKVYLLQSEIYRLFGTIDFLFKSLTTGDLIATVRAEILREFELSKSTSMELFPIRKRGRFASSGNPILEQLMAKFPFNQSPPEVQKRILGNIMSPQRKLNILKACPLVGPLMGWDQVNLQFELIYPIMAKKNLLNKRDVFNLSRVSPQFRDAILKHFESSLAIDLEDKHPVEYRVYSREDECYSAEQAIVRRALEAGGPEWCRRNPMLFRDWPCEFPLFDDPRATWGLVHITETLSRSQFWNLNVLWYKKPGSILHEVVTRDWLRLTPNLRHLKIAFMPANPEIEMNEVNEQDVEQPLPELRHLKYLIVNGNVRTVEKFLDRYTRTLKQLAIFVFAKHWRPEMSTVTAPLPAPELTTLEFNQFGGKVDFFERTLGRLGRWPLKVIHFGILRSGPHANENIKVRFSSLLRPINQFGGTLEELTLTFQEKDSHSPTDELATGPPTWITELNFSKLRRYKQTNCIGFWALLLQFPQLEELILQDVGRTAETFFEEEGLLGLSWNREEMRVANIWKLLPVLGKILLKRRDVQRPLAFTRA